MSTAPSYISTDRECDHCGYNLRGLPEGGKCPECGAPIRSIKRKSSGTMSEEAPTRFIRRLQIGFSLASVAILGLVVVPIFLGVFSGMMGISSGIIYWATSLLNFGAPFIWVLGIWIITAERPNRKQIVPDKVLDDDRFRMVVRVMSAAWPIYQLAAMALGAVNASATPSPVLTIPLSIVLFISGTIAWIGLMPTCVYFAELGYWASHDHLAQRLRSTAWVMAVFGTLTVVLTAIGALNIAPSSAASIASIFTIIMVIIAVIVFLLTVIQLGTVMKWVIKHQQLAAGSAERVRTRIEHDSMPPSTVVTDLRCLQCKYDLEGLPFGGLCPECGESYADRTPMPILDPANMHLDRDESVIDVEEGDNRGIYFNQELDAFGKPKSSAHAYEPVDDGIPDEGDIPLSDDHFGPDEPLGIQDADDLDENRPSSDT
jgi:hypothetical protein